MISLGAVFGAAAIAASSPAETVVTSQVLAAREAIVRQADTLVPQFGRPTAAGDAAGRAADREQGSRVDHTGLRIGTRPAVIKILKAAALRHQLDPRLVVALSYWESGWDQSRISVTGAVGLMQVEPPTAAEAGPALLGRQVNVSDPVDNAEVGTAVLRQNLDSFGSPEMALAAYYQGPNSLRENGMVGDTPSYVAGILALAARLNV